MSDFKFNCPHCQQSLEAPRDMLGETIECPSCNGSIQLPEPDSKPDANEPSLHDQKGSKCRSCGRLLEAGTVLCTACGTNQKTGKRLQLESEPQQRQSPDTGPTTSTRACPYCGESILRTAKKCKHCGEFLDPSMRSQSRQNQSRSMVKPLFVAILLAAVACGVGYVVLKQMKEAAAQQQEKESEGQYLQNLATAHDKIVEASVKCTEMCSGYSEQWRKGIEMSEYGGTPEMYIRIQSREFEKDGSTAAIQDYKTAIDALMAKLSEPPTRYQQAHQSLVAVYGVYAQLYGCAESPSGSLMSYNNKVNELQSEFIKYINQLKVLLPKNQ